MVMLLILSGLGLLYLGAEGLVRGSSSLSLRFGVHPLLAGLTVVAFGTSSPELTVSVLAGLKQHGDVALGNVIGSNIFNIAFILGLSALILPLRIHLNLIRRDIPIMIFAALTALPILVWGGIPRIVGLLRVTALAAYMAATVWWARQSWGSNLD